MIPHRVSIDERSRFGDWEGDTVEDKKGTGGIATHVERKSRYLIAAKLTDKKTKPWRRKQPRHLNEDQRHTDTH